MERAVFVTSVLLGILIAFGNGLKLDGIMEGSCSTMPSTPTSTVDMTWLNSVRRWYVLGGSKFYLYLSTRRHSGGEEAFNRVPEDEFYYESCLQMHTASNGLWTQTGFNPGSVTLTNVTDVGPGVRKGMPIGDITIPQASQGSRHYITLTDNRTFYLFSICFVNPDQKAWALYSTRESLSQKTLDIIRNHLTSQGYDEEQFAFLRFNNCRPGVLNQHLSESSQPTKSLKRNRSPNSRIWR